MISYIPLFRLLEKKGLPQTFLIENGIDSKTLQKLRTNGNITVKTLNRICLLLKCKPNDVLDILPDHEPEEGQG